MEQLASQLSEITAKNYLSNIIVLALLFASRISCRYILPVDHVPDSFEIVRSDIFILKIIGMLPHINP